MIFWGAIGVAALFTWIAVRIGFFASWILFFNILLSATVALFATPLLIAKVPDATATSYGCAMTLVGVAVGTLLIAYGVCFACLSGRFVVAFPMVMDTTGAGLLGFATGFFVAGFLAFAFCLTPLAQSARVKAIGFSTPMERTTTTYACWWCDRFQEITAPLACEVASKDAMEALLARAEPPKKKENRSADASDTVSLDAPPPVPAAKASDKSGKPAPGVQDSSKAKAADTAADSADKARAESAASPRPNAKDEGSAASAKPDANPFIAVSPLEDRPDFQEAQLLARKTTIDSADAVEAAIHRPGIRIIEVADSLTADRFSPRATRLLKDWVSQGGVLWANNDALQLFDVQSMALPDIPAGARAVPGSAHPIVLGCNSVILLGSVQKHRILPSPQTTDLLLHEPSGANANLPPSVALWSLVRCGKGWITNPKPIDRSQGDSDRFYRNFCLFCLGVPPLGAPAVEHKRPAKPAEAKSPASALAGDWVALGGARFRIEDEGKNVSIELVSSTTLVQFTGVLTPRDDASTPQQFTGAVELVLEADAPRQHTLHVTAVVKDPNRLSIVCADWPVLNKGRKVSTRDFRELWTRAKDPFSHATAPKVLDKPTEIDPNDPFATPPGGRADGAEPDW